jgi:AbrB family looped-hinge helix DNA binding protein
MNTTIDKAGRIVIPAAMRADLGFKPGQPLEILVEDGSVRIFRKVRRPKLVRVGKRLIARPQVKAKDLPRVDLAALVEEERSRWPL